MNLLLLLALALLVGLLVRTILVRAPRYGKPFLLRLGAVLLGVIVMGLALSGRLHWLLGVLGGLLPFIGRLARWAAPLLIRLFPLYQQHRQRRGASKSQGQRSEVRSELLLMSLDHDSGNVAGMVQAGPFAGRSLDSLSLAELKQLHWQCCNEDPEGVRLLEAYLQRHRPHEWDQPASDASSANSMSEAEALAILGLEAGAGRAEIIAAHKRMMARMHPDRGGSTYLAAKINQAKEQLLRTQRG